MKYRGLAFTIHEFMTRLYASSFIAGSHVGSAVLSDPRPGTLEEKLNRAMEEYFNGEVYSPALEAKTEPPAIEPVEQPKRGPGRPPRNQNFNQPKHGQEFGQIDE